MHTHKIAILAGDGIGPEIMDEAKKVLAKIKQCYGIDFDYNEALVGGAAIDETGSALPKETLRVCENSEAVLFGSVGGPKWESLPPQQQPERGALLPLRKHFDLFANLRPAMVYQPLVETSPLKNRLLEGGLDLLIVRELTSGIYFGSPKKIDEHHAFDTLVYKKNEVERIAHVAFAAAKRRKKKLVSIDKANVLTSMVFWRKIVGEVAQQYPEVELSHMYVDNAAMQLMSNPKQFDVLLTPNMFGDILSDEASMISGSLGMLPSASINEKSFGLYEPSGGSAPDIAGKGIANPIAMILCVALMLEHTFAKASAARSIVVAIENVLASGLRTADIASHGQTPVGTAEIGDAVVDAIKPLENS